MDIRALNVFLEVPSSGERYEAVALAGREALGELWTFSLTLLLPEGEGPDPEEVLWAKVCISFESGEACEPQRQICGRLANITTRQGIPSSAGDRPEQALDWEWQLTIVPEAWALTQSSRIDTHLNQSLREIFVKLLARAGLLEDTDFEFRLAGGESPIEFALQYDETDWHFLCRLAEQAGITCFWIHRESQGTEPAAEVLVFADANQDLRISSDEPFTCVDTGGAAPANLVRDLELRTSTVVRRYTVDNYNYAAPQIDLGATAKVHESGLGEVIEYGAPHLTPEDGEALATRRSEEQAHQRRRLRGTTSAPVLSAGTLICIEGSQPELPEQRVLWVEHELIGGAYYNRFESIDGTLTYRPPRRTPRPRIGGVLNGIVQAAQASQQLPAIDDKGRYIIQLLCDSASRLEDKVTLPIRKAQPFSGPGGVGMQSPLLPGTEVLVAFENADPDRPVIIGAVPTEVTQSPVTVRNADRSVLRSAGGLLVQFK